MRVCIDGTEEVYLVPRRHILSCFGKTFWAHQCSFVGTDVSNQTAELLYPLHVHRLGVVLAINRHHDFVLANLLADEDINLTHLFAITPSQLDVVLNNGIRRKLPLNVRDKQLKLFPQRLAHGLNRSSYSRRQKTDQRLLRHNHASDISRSILR